MSAGVGDVRLPEPELIARRQRLDRVPRRRDIALATAAGSLLILGVAAVDIAHRRPAGDALVLALFGGIVLLAISVGLPVLVARRRIGARGRAVPADAAELLVLERQRLARELHDVGAAAVTAMIVQAAAAATLVGRDDDGVRRALASVQRLGTTAMTEIYQLVGSLRSPAAEEAAAETFSPPAHCWRDIDRLITDLDGTGLRVVTTGLDRMPPLAPAVQLAGYRVVQEALTNALKHSAWREVSILATVDAEVHLEVSSRGPALSSVSRAPSSGAGLRGLQERVEAAGGRLLVRADQDRFVVAADLPVPVPVPVGRRAAAAGRHLVRPTSENVAR